MKSPGRKLADWVVDDPKRFTITPNTDRAFYTFLYNLAFLCILGLAITLGLAYL